MNDQAVMESIDTGADLNGSGGDQTAGQSDQTALQTSTGGDADSSGGKAADSSGGAAGGAGTDTQSASGGAAKTGDEAKLVPLAALHEVRNENKSLKAKLAELEARPALTPEHIKALETLSTKDAAAAKKDPDFLEDPKGYIDSKLTQTQEALKKLDEANASRGKQEEAQRDFQTLVTTLGQKEAEFTKTTPDYMDALTHVRNIRTSQLQLMYPSATLQQIQQKIGMEEIQGAQHALANGMDPIAFVYNYAKTMGYTPKAAAAAAAIAAAAPKTDKDAVRTMGGSGGGADSTADEDAEEEANTGAFRAALAERFGVKKKR